MILPINDRYRIKSDQYCWMVQVQRRRTLTDQFKEDWRPVTYHPTFEQAVTSLSERMLRTSSAIGFEKGLEEIKRICDTLSQALPSLSVTLAENEE